MINLKTEKCCFSNLLGNKAS